MLECITLLPDALPMICTLQSGVQSHRQEAWNVSRQGVGSFESSDHGAKPNP